MISLKFVLGLKFFKFREYYLKCKVGLQDTLIKLLMFMLIKIEYPHMESLDFLWNHFIQTNFVKIIEQYRDRK